MANYTFQYQATLSLKGESRSGKLEVESSSITGAFQKFIKVLWERYKIAPDEVLRLTLTPEEQEPSEPDMMGLNEAERAEQMAKIQRDLK